MNRRSTLNPLLSFIAVLLVAATPAFAQQEDTSINPDSDIEGLFNKDENAAPPPAPSTRPNSAQSATQPPAATADEVGKSAVINNVSDLGKLSEFNDIAVIQKRYLPKTGRFEAFIGPTLVLNDAFFINAGGDLRLNYSFSERYTLEAVGFLLGSSQRSATKELFDNRGVITTSLITPKMYYGFDFKYTPVYGKMTYLNNRITPFDLYFSLGLGLTNTNQGSTEPTVHFGTGQTFARTKNTAIRWDFSWNVFSAQPQNQGRGIYNSLFITMGMSFFFPDAGYR